MKITSISSVVVAAAVLTAGGAHAQRPPRNGGGGGVTCPDEGGFSGTEAYMGAGAKAAPLRGAIGCVDAPKEVTNGAGQTSIGSLIYGPMEAGFTNDQLSRFFGCTNADAAIPGGLDTLLAQRIAEYECNLEDGEADILDSCGGHANPYHYHERMTCLYNSDESTGHSTRVGTALDGNGIYGKYINGGIEPTDLDACGGRTGITPDSNGEEVYYYVIQDRAPFTVGCFGPVASVQECRALYNTCGDGDAYEVTTNHGTIMYDPDCPCYDYEGSNIGDATAPVTTTPPATDPPATDPPATDPPATDPPATDPPATDPPATDPPATDPPATDPPATDPPAAIPTKRPTKRPSKRTKRTRSPLPHQSSGHDDSNDDDHHEKDSHGFGKHKTLIYGCAGAAGVGLLAAAAVCVNRRRKTKKALVKAPLTKNTETKYYVDASAKEIATGKEMPQNEVPIYTV